MLIVQVAPTWLIHKMATKDHCRQNLYRTLNLQIYGGGNIYLDRDMRKKKKQENLKTFLKGQDERHGFS